MCMWSNKPRQGASRSIRRKLFCKEVIEKDSIFPCRHRGMVYRHGYGFSHADCFPPSLCFRCLTSFPLAGFSFNPRACSRNTVRNAYYFTNFLFIPDAGVERAAVARNIPFTWNIKLNTLLLRERKNRLIRK